MTQEGQKVESRAEEVARVRGYLSSQAMKRTPAQIVEALKEAQQQFVQATMSIPEDLFHTPPQPGEWSGAEIMAHVLAIANFDLKTIVALLEKGERGPDWNKLDDYEVSSREAGLAELESMREKLIKAALNTDPNAHLDVTWSHPEFGLFQWREGLLFARVHTLDHARQMAGVAAHFAQTEAQQGASQP